MEIVVLQKMAVEAPWLWKQIKVINKDLKNVKICHMDVSDVFVDELYIGNSLIERPVPGIEIIDTKSRPSSFLTDLAGLLLLPILLLLKIYNTRY
jgi:hypothetical protein